MPLVGEDEGGRIARLLRVSGKVQGVWYRGWVCEEAAARGLTGWVRNRRDGTLEALFAGPAAAVREMIEACREGPPAARVLKIEVEAARVPDGAGFEARPTA